MGSGWGRVLLLLCVAIASVSQAQTFKTVVNFNGSDRASPSASLVQGLNGNLYGTTNGGGKYDGGTIFEVTPAGELTTLYNFCSKANCADGQNPRARLIEATDGNLYGTTFYGGNANGAGTLFRITPAGKLTTLYRFCAKGGAGCTDSAYPNGVVQGADGRLYGTTEGGGAGTGAANAKADTTDTCGELFADAFETNPFLLIPVTFFCVEYHCADGWGPQDTLTTFNDEFPEETTLRLRFPDDAAQSGRELFYGTTSGGGAYGDGVVFKASPAGAYTRIYSFCQKANCADGAFPKAPVIEGTDGNLCGTTSGGNGNRNCPIEQGCGTVFRLTPSGVLTTLHSFEVTDGRYPAAGLVQATNGTFYGATRLDGAYGEGTIFTLSMGLGPFAKTVPTAGKAGTTVIILGTDLTKASIVRFNGKAAEFKIVSPTEITATVPSGATTGTVEVTTPSGTLKSWPFQVL
jgi:uncharacterized repeat protein (TIGR03803 family)